MKIPWNWSKISWSNSHPSNRFLIHAKRNTLYMSEFENKRGKFAKIDGKLRVFCARTLIPLPPDSRGSRGSDSRLSRSRSVESGRRAWEPCFFLIYSALASVFNHMVLQTRVLFSWTMWPETDRSAFHSRILRGNGCVQRFLIKAVGVYRYFPIYSGVWNCVSRWKIMSLFVQQRVRV